jgi:hypothetical protein
MYAKINNNTVVEYPVNIYEAHPNVSFPVGWTGGVVEGDSYVLVKRTNIPESSHTKTVTESTPVLSNGEWVQVWTLVDASAEVVAQRVESKWAAVREQRNSLLFSSDWTQLSDSPLTAEKKTEWQTYRQSLRDITLQPNPFNLTWQTKPV